MIYNAPSIIQQMEEIEKSRAALYTMASPDVYVYQGNFQLHLSASVLLFLSIANQADVSFQQRILFSEVQQHCISVFQEMASSILNMDYRSIGWGGTVMVLAGLRTIAASHISLSEQRDAARRILDILKGQSGFTVAKI